MASASNSRPTRKLLSRAQTMPAGAGQPGGSDPSPDPVGRRRPPPASRSVARPGACGPAAAPSRRLTPKPTSSTAWQPRRSACRRCTARRSIARPSTGRPGRCPSSRPSPLRSGSRPLSPSSPEWSCSSPSAGSASANGKPARSRLPGRIQAAHRQLLLRTLFRLTGLAVADDGQRRQDEHGLVVDRRLGLGVDRRSVLIRRPGQRFVVLGFADDGNGGLIAVGDGFTAGSKVAATAWRSRDGRTWSSATVDFPPIPR